MSSSLGGGLKLLETGLEFDNEAEKKHWAKLFKMIEKGKVPGPTYDYPLEKMPTRAPPDPSKNIIKVKGGCPPPLKACDARKAQAAGKSCPRDEYLAYPYIQTESGELCYANLNSAALQREMQEDMKALARKAILDLIKVLAAIEDNSATPGMCNVVNSMNSKPAGIRQAYCTNLKSGNESVCNWNNDTCSPRAGIVGGPAPSRAPGGLVGLRDEKKEEAPPPPAPKPATLRVIKPTVTAYDEVVPGENLDLTDEQQALLALSDLSNRAKGLIASGKSTQSPIYQKLKKNIITGKINTAADINAFVEKEQQSGGQSLGRAVNTGSVAPRPAAPSQMSGKPAELAAFAKGL